MRGKHDHNDSDSSALGSRVLDSLQTETEQGSRSRSTVYRTILESYGWIYYEFRGKKNRKSGIALGMSQASDLAALFMLTASLPAVVKFEPFDPDNDRHFLAHKKILNKR